jgi:hypothetical protein
MNHEPVDLSIDRRATATTRGNQPRRQSPIRSYFAPMPKSAAPPEALDEVFASLAQNASDSRQAGSAIAVGKPSLDAAPLVALAANLERQHERLASFLRELEAGVRN